MNGMNSPKNIIEKALLFSMIIYLNMYANCDSLVGSFNIVAKVPVTCSIVFLACVGFMTQITILEEMCCDRLTQVPTESK